jgi:sugar fermentation stimulation protein A
LIRSVPASVPIRGPVRPARLVDRPNRFLIRARLEPEDAVVEAHLPDPGRLREFVAPGTPVWLRPAEEPNRRTRWSAALAANAAKTLVSLDTQLPNPLIRRALDREELDELAGQSVDRPEVVVGRHRFDFRLTDPAGNGLLLEVKGVNWAIDRVGLFPDAPTERGTRQVMALADHVMAGGAAAVLFVCQRNDVDAVRTAPEIDPDFSRALDAARRAGVRVFARRCLVTLEEMVLGRPVPVHGPDATGT